MWNKIAHKYYYWAKFNRWYYTLFVLKIKNFCSPKKVLDICCGPGILKEEFTKFFPDAEVVGLDSSREMCKLSNSLMGDALHLPFKDESFDLITFCFALHELKVKEALKEAKRVLKSKGIIAIADLNSELPETTKIFVKYFFNLILGKEYANHLLLSWRRFPKPLELLSELKDMNFEILHSKLIPEIWIVAKKI
ncbi:MAG: methyltransferase domain-containing protein [Archaeoglobaceae archaeon]